MAKVDWEQRYEHELLSARTSVRYCDKVLRTYSTVDVVVRVLATMSSSAAVGGLAVWKTGFGIVAWGTLAGLAAILNAVTLVIKPSETMKTFAALREMYVALRYDVEGFGDFLATRPSNEETVKRWTPIKNTKERVDKSSPPAHRWLLESAESEVRAEMGLPSLEAVDEGMARARGNPLPEPPPSGRPSGGPPVPEVSGLTPAPSTAEPPPLLPAAQTAPPADPPVPDKAKKKATKK